MNLVNLIALLQMALQLLTAAQGPNVPAALRDHAIQVGNYAIAYANKSMAQLGTATQVIVPEIKKEVMANVSCDFSETLGTKCNGEVQYFENGERKNWVVHVQSDDNGSFLNAPGNPASIGMTKGSDGKPVALFTYIPTGEKAQDYMFCSDFNNAACPGLRINKNLTIEVNGAKIVKNIVTRYYSVPIP